MMFPNNITKIISLFLILFIFINKSFSLTFNDSINLTSKDNYFEFSKDLEPKTITNVNLNNIIIDGKNHYFIGGFNISSQNVTFKNIIFKSFDSFLSAYNSGISIINCKFIDSNLAVSLIDSNFSLINNSFINISTGLLINSSNLSANISQNVMNNVNATISVFSKEAIGSQALILNSNVADFYGLFKAFNYESSYYFNLKQYWEHEGGVYEVANSYKELSDLAAKKVLNISLGSNITLPKILSITNNLNLYGKNNYLLSNINKDYSIVLIGEINFIADSMNIISNSGVMISNMGANASITDSKLFAKETAYYQLEGNLEITNVSFYFQDIQSDRTGIHLESGKANANNVRFFNADYGIVALTDSIINGITPECSNHSSYSIMLTNLDGLFSKESVIIPKKSSIYSKEYDYYNGIVIQDYEKNLSCSYPGFLNEGKYPWETEYEEILGIIKGYMNLFSRAPDTAISKINLTSSYGNYSISYNSKTPELLSSSGEIFNPYMNPKTASLGINISKNNLWIEYLANIVILPILDIDSSRVISEGVFDSSQLLVHNEFTLDSNGSVISGNAINHFNIKVLDNASSLMVKKNGEIIFNSDIEDYYDLSINLINDSKIIPEISGSYDFYWMNNGSIFYIERLNLKIINSFLIESTSASQNYYENIKKIILQYYSDYENGIVDFSGSLINNMLSLKEELTIQRDLGSIVSITIPKNIYSIIDWADNSCVTTSGLFS